MKYCVGKAIPLSDETYLLLRNAIEEKYPKIYDKYLSLEPTTLVQPREKYIADLEKKVVSHGIEIEALRKQVKHLTSLQYKDEITLEGIERMLEEVDRMVKASMEANKERKKLKE